jgi:hypothetical protein
MKKIILLATVLALLLQPGTVLAGVSPNAQTITGNTGEMKLASFVYTNTENVPVEITLQLFNLSSYVTTIVPSYTIENGKSYTFYLVCSIPSSTVEGVVIFKDNAGVAKDMATLKLSPTAQPTATGNLTVNYPDSARVGENIQFIIKDASTGSAIPYGSLSVSAPVQFVKTFTNGVATIKPTEAGYWSGSISADNYKAFYWIVVVSGEASSTPSSSSGEVMTVTVIPNPPVRGEYVYVAAVDNAGKIVSGVTLSIAGTSTSNPGSIVVPNMNILPVAVKRGDEVIFSTTYTTTERQQQSSSGGSQQQIVERTVYVADQLTLWIAIALAVGFVVFLLYYFKPEWFERLLAKREPIPT